MTFSLYPPALAFAALMVGIGLVSVPAALIVGGGLVLAGWIFRLELHRRAAS